MDNRRRTLNDIISTIFLMNVGTVPTVVETCHHLISIRLYFILTILIMEEITTIFFFNNC
jgi:hypothetical protein